ASSGEAGGRASILDWRGMQIRYHSSSTTSTYKPMYVPEAPRSIVKIFSYLFDCINTARLISL
ncbi:hypothetical protein KA005_05160, partial [bacterium]|nr:hypothetical protein [bacterium]